MQTVQGGLMTYQSELDLLGLKTKILGVGSSNELGINIFGMDL